MAHIEEITISGYRAISQPLTLTGLGPYVALYGDNAVGKSSVLRAVSLLARVCANYANARGTVETSDEMFAKVGEDRWMINDRSGSTAIEVVLSSGASVRIDIGPHKNQWRVDIAVNRVDVGVSGGGGGVHELLSSITVGAGESPRMPIAESMRRDLHNAFGSRDPRVRARIRSVLGAVPQLFPALGAGAMEVLINPPIHEKDLAWVSDSSTVPLDQLGGGVQSAVGTLGSLVLANSSVVCVEEPEAFVGARALAGIARIFREAKQRNICEQVWIATHSVALVDATDPIVILERENGVVTARQGTAADLGRFAQPAAEPPQHPVNPFGRLGADGSVRIPDAAIRRHGLRPGDIMFFRDNGDALEVIPEAKMHAALEVKNSS